MPPRKKRIRSDDSENSTVDSRGLSSESDVQKSENQKSLKYQNKKISSEDYDGDCELDRNDRNRMTRRATRSARVLKQKSTNNDGSTSSTPVVSMDTDDCYGFEKLTTPVLCSPVTCFNVSTTPDNLPVTMELSPSQLPIPKPLFETPVDKPIRKTKRKRVTKVRKSWDQPIHREEEILALFDRIDTHELLVE